MQNTPKIRRFHRLTSLAMAAVLLLSLAACGSSTSSKPNSSGGSQMSKPGSSNASIPGTESDASAGPESDPSSEDGNGSSIAETSSNGGGTSGNGGGGTTSSGGSGGFTPPTYDLSGKTINIWTPSGAPKKNTLEYASWKYVEEKYKCTIKFTKVSYEVCVNKMSAAAISGKADCDIWEAAWYDTYPSFIGKSMATPLNKYYPFDQDPNWKSDENWNLNTWNGNLYGLNYGAEPPRWGMWYNKALLRQAGAEDPATLVKQNKWTWEKFLEICQKVTKTTSSGVEQWGYYDEYLFVTCILTNGGEIIGRDSSGNYKFNLNSEKAKKGMNFALDLLNKYKVVPHVGSVGDPILLDMFKQGNVAFTTYAPEYGPEAVAKGIKASDLGYTYPPKGPDATDYVIHAATYSPVYVVPPQLDETWKKQVICVLQDMLCVWDSSKPFAVKKADILDIGFSKSEYKGIYENNKDFMLNGGKKNKVAYLNSFKLFDMLNENLIYPLFKGETTMESALSKVTPMAQSRIDEYVALTKGK